MPHGPTRGAVVALACALAAPVALAFVEGPYPGMTGGFGEPTCRQCHFDNPVDEPPGAVSLSGIPEQYTPGRQYLITVRLHRPAVHRGGFQVSARLAEPPRTGRQAGALAALDARVQVVAAQEGDVRYLQHTKGGSETATPGEMIWTFAWTAPADGGAVVFHLAANASNADDSPLGDFIYATEARSAR